MESNGSDKLPEGGKAEDSETTIGIKLKTMDSQTYNMRVDKQVSVPALKEQIASVTGVLSERQRLICRGRVLKDDQLLSAYHVEDGHTLHLVARQPLSQGSQAAPNFSEARSGTNNSSESSPSVVIETYNLPAHGDGVPPEIGRIVSAILGSFGFPSSPTGGNNETQGERAASEPNRAGGSLGVASANSSGYAQPPVIPDSLTTLSQYLHRLRTELLEMGFGRANDRSGAVDMTNSDLPSDSQTGRDGLPTTSSLAGVMQNTRQILIEQVGGSLDQLGRLLENQAAVIDSSERSNNQSNMWRAGVVYHNLGAYFLELGRTTMSTRFGQAPSEAVVNAGPAVFISASGPNPLMVQPLPFQLGSNLGTQPIGATQATPGNGFLPRRIDIQIRRGSSMMNPDASQNLHGNSTQHASGQRATTDAGSDPHGAHSMFRSDGPSLTGESVRVVPVRTLVAAIPASLSRHSSDSSGLHASVQRRLEHLRQGRPEQRFHGTSEHVSVGLPAESERESRQQAENTENSARNGSIAGAIPNQHFGQNERSSVHSANSNNRQSRDPETNQESERHFNSVLQFLGSLFPGGDIHVEEANLNSAAPSSAADHESTSGGSAEQSVTEEGIFFSNLLQQIMPVITQRTEAQENASEPGMPDNTNQDDSSRTGRSGRSSGSDPSPSSKRQKRE